MIGMFHLYVKTTFFEWRLEGNNLHDVVTKKWGFALLSIILLALLDTTNGCTENLNPTLFALPFQYKTYLLTCQTLFMVS
jgi:hypothetical protein